MRIIINVILLVIFSVGLSNNAKPEYHQLKSMPADHLSAEQIDFFEFCSELFLWTAKFAVKLKDPDEQTAAIYPRLTKSEIKGFNTFLENNRNTLYLLGQNDKLHRTFDIALIPEELYQFIREAFSIESPTAQINPELLKYQLMGGDFDFGENGKRHIEGFYHLIKSFNLKSWLPISEFLKKFRDTLSVDRFLSQSIGFTILPMFEYYFDYMDPLNRLSLLREVVKQQKYTLAESKKFLLEKLAIQVFQNSGPVFIKLLQQLQEELRGSGPLNSVLAGLKNSKPMNPRIIEKRVRAHLNIKSYEDSFFKFKRKPLGIASIAQTHGFTFRNQRYVVKNRKNRIKEKFEREISSIHQMVREESIFDKGMKQYIKHIELGIREELDFNFERKFIQLGQISYQNSIKNVSTIKNAFDKDLGLEQNPLPSHGPSDLLFMTFADGKPVGHHMSGNDPQILYQLYQGILRLYEVFLEAALSPNSETNFYHGDLHRENIFFDEPKDLITVIDFGNAGMISRFTQEMLIKIFHFAEQTHSNEELLLDAAISKLAQTLKDFIESKSSAESKSDSHYRDIFFNVCFNPKTTMPDKRHAARFLLNQRDELSKEAKMEGKNQQAKIRDQIDFINALTNNCLSGPKSTLLSSLASHTSTSEKLKTVFQEMLKNGISIPRELIFFNKSKALLEGIMRNLATQIKNLHPNTKLSDPDNTFLKMIEKMGNVHELD